MIIKKLYILFILMVLFVGNTSAYVYSVEHNGIQVKFYNEDTDKEKIFDMIDRYNTTGLKYLLVFDKGKTHIAGQYFVGIRAIRLFNIHETVFAHELAHMCQEDRGDYLYEMIFHKGQFYDCLEKVEAERRSLYDLRVKQLNLLS